MSFKSGKQFHGLGFWKLPLYLLEYPVVLFAIEREAGVQFWQDLGRVSRSSFKTYRRSFGCRTRRLLKALGLRMITLPLGIVSLLAT